MSRIRSVHPGFFTDENLVCVGAFARLLFIGLGVEADDKGVFEWKPLTIKMRLFPADNVLVEELLAELVNAGAIKSFHHGGRKYGAIRNFCRFQRPKKPNDVHPITPEIVTFVALDRDSTELVGNRSGTGGEKSSQMEEGEEDGGEEGKDTFSNENDDYAFSGRVIRLTATDFSRWERSYPAIDLPAALQARDDWLALQPAADRKRWFNSTSNFLAKRQQEAKARGSPVDIIA